MTEIPPNEDNVERSDQRSIPHASDDHVYSSASTQSADWGWLPCVVVAGTSIVLALFSSGLAILVAMVVLAGPEILSDPEGMQLWLGEFSLTPIGLLVVVAPGQMTFLTLAIGGSLLSRESIPQRLALKLGSQPTFIWILFALGTPTVGLLMSLILTALMRATDTDPSQQVQNIETMLSSFTGGRILWVIGLVAILPGICEELLFRGFIQSRLLKKWPPILAIGFSSICFGLAHIDPMQMFVVLPIGIWLGIVAWMSESIWPAIFGHIVNNVSSILLTQMVAQGVDESTAINSAILASLPFFTLSVGFMFAMKPTAKDNTT